MNATNIPFVPIPSAPITALVSMDTKDQERCVPVSCKCLVVVTIYFHRKMGGGFLLGPTQSP